MEGMSLEVMDHIEEMQKKMTMMQEQMKRNMELMVKSKNLNTIIVNAEESCILLIKIIFYYNF